MVQLKPFPPFSNSFIFLISIIAFHLSNVSATALSTNCNKVLDETGFDLIPVIESNNNKDRLDQQRQLFEIVYEFKVPRERCSMSSNNSLVVGFKRITSVSSVLIHEAAFGTDLMNGDVVKVSLRRGSTSFECKFSEGRSVELSNGRYANYSCLMSNRDAQHSTDGIDANAIEIKSIAKSPLMVNLDNLKAEGSFDWLFAVQPATDNSIKPEPDSCLTPGLYPGQRLSPEKQFYLAGESVSFLCPEDSVLESSSNAHRTCQTDGQWSGSTPLCQAKKQWYESILLNQELTPLTNQKENVLIAAYFNRDFDSITEITVDFELEFDSTEWKRCFMEDNNAIFQIADSKNNILKIGPLPLREPKSLKWNSITVSAQNFVPHPCTNCSVGVTFRKYHWDGPIVKAIRAFGSTSTSSPDRNRRHGIEQCPPITPYYGMPETYKNYELVMDGSINDLLLKTPCREGFKFVGRPSEVSQCKGGAWHGSGFPDCEAIRVKAPPEVEHASWVYVQFNGQHQTVYICENGYDVTGDGKAIYSIEKDDWTSVPTCHNVSIFDTLRGNWHIVLVVCLSAAALASAYPIYKRIVLWRRSNSSYSPTSSTELDGEEYVLPVNKPPSLHGDLRNPSFFFPDVEHVYEKPQRRHNNLCWHSYPKFS